MEHPIFYKPLVGKPSESLWQVPNYSVRAHKVEITSLFPKSIRNGLSRWCIRVRWVDPSATFFCITIWCSFIVSAFYGLIIVHPSFALIRSSPFPVGTYARKSYSSLLSIFRS